MPSHLPEMTLPHELDTLQYTPKIAIFAHFRPIWPIRADFVQNSHFDPLLGPKIVLASEHLFLNNFFQLYGMPLKLYRNDDIRVGKVCRFSAKTDPPSRSYSRFAEHEIVESRRRRRRRDFFYKNFYKVEITHINFPCKLPRWRAYRFLG